MPLLAALPGPYRALLKPLLVGLAAVLLALAFAKLGGEVIEGDTRAFDVFLLREAQALRLGHSWLAEIMRDLSGLGSTTVMTLVTLLGFFYLRLIDRRVEALLVVSSVITGAVAVSLFKSVFGRIRPAPDYAELAVSGLSFPSGHASMSAIVFLSLGALLASSRDLPAERIYILAAAAAMTLLVGISRAALGVHWATDVIGGWAFGAAWALAWLLLASQLAKKSGP